MHESLNSGIYDHTLTTVSALYEPYAGFYPEYYPHPEPWRFPLFQPGFNYRFVECECELNLEGPVPYEYTAFDYTNTSVLTIDKYEADFESIAHPNHTAIAIDLGGCCNPGQNIRRCYDNWWSPPITRGEVIKFNDNIFNNNVTITPQDSISINNPDLINNLDPGLYNIIKTDVNGTNDETVIFKENN